MRREMRKVIMLKIEFDNTLDEVDDGFNDGGDEGG